jgi:hypothetical protein
MIKRTFKKISASGQYRSARTGAYVMQSTSRKRPSTTISSTVSAPQSKPWDTAKLAKVRARTNSRYKESFHPVINDVNSTALRTS